jgi:hypothetical protein
MRYPTMLQAIGWTLVAGLDLALNRAAATADGIGWAAYAAVTLGASGFAISSLLFLFHRRWLPARGAAAAGVAVAAALAGATIWYLAIAWLDRAVGYPGAEPLLDGLFGRGMLLLFIMLTWHAALLALRASARAADAERLATEARLVALRYQLDPHFLFNVLNSTIMLIDEDPRRAQTMLTLLSELLRETLADGAAPETTLDRELALIDRYIEIQHVRFEDKLQVVRDVDAAARACALPPLVVHALVENAVKHGLRTASSLPVRIGLAARYAGDVLAVEVTNTGRLAPRGTGVGLQNVADRLAALYPGSHRFAIAEHDGAVRATMEIRAPRVLA